MSTIGSKKIIDEIIAGNGYYQGDPRVALIVEYTNQAGQQTWGVTWTVEHPVRQERYLLDSEFVQNPREIWRAEEEQTDGVQR